jgi:hypothetical protein
MKINVKNGLNFLVTSPAARVFNVIRKKWMDNFMKTGSNWVTK